MLDEKQGAIHTSGDTTAPQIIRRRLTDRLQEIQARVVSLDSVEHRLVEIRKVLAAVQSQRLSTSQRQRLDEQVQQLLQDVREIERLGRYQFSSDHMV